MTVFLYTLAGLRILIGILPIFAADSSSKLLGFPQEHNNATSRLMGRLFGVRDIGLGILVIGMMDNPQGLVFSLLLNLGTDIADATMIAIPLVKGQGIRKAAGLSILMALCGACCWFVAWYQLS